MAPALFLPDTPELIGRAPEFLRTVRLIRRMACCDATVLLHGETGTGKELAARAMHYHGERRAMPFIPINCGAIPEPLVESELFGHVRGAFTDARDAQSGLVAQADGGTLFLDEVDALSAKAQVVLLRFLQDGSYRQVGGRTALQAQVRVVAATNADLPRLVRDGVFREDLYYRLAIVPVGMPALRERPGDAALLGRHFLERLIREQRGGPRRFDGDSLQLLERNDWPGNVRQLGNMLQRAWVLCDEDCLQITPAMIGLAPNDTAQATGPGLREERLRAIAAFERGFVRRLLLECKGNVSLAARRAGAERRSFGRLMKRHGIDRTEFAPQ